MARDEFKAVAALGTVSGLLFLVLLSCGKQTGSIEGTVLLANASAHEGTLVTLRSGGMYSGGEQTDPRGQFTLRNVLPGRYQLEAIRPAYEPYVYEDIVLRPGEKLQLNPILLVASAPRAASGGIVGLVALVDGGSPDRVTVYVDELGVNAEVDSQGRYVIPDLVPGAYTLQFRAAGYSPRQASVDAPSGATATVPLISLRAAQFGSAALTGARLSGKVTLVGGGNPAGVIVSIDGTSHITTTDSTGRYALANIPSGTCSLSFQKPNYEGRRKQGIWIGPGEQLAVNVELEPLSHGGRLPSLDEDPRPGSVTGLVANEAGNPLAGVEVRLVPGNLVTLTDDNGAYMFFELPPNLYVVSARLMGFRQGPPVSAIVYPGEETMANTLILQASEGFPVDEQTPSTVLGTLVLEGAEDFSGVSVALLGTNHVAVTSSNGAYEFKDVAPGNYTVHASAQNYEPAQEEIEVLPGGALVVPEMVLAQIVVHPRVVYTDPTGESRGVVVADYVEIQVQFDQRMDNRTVRGAFTIEPDVNYRVFFGEDQESAPGSREGVSGRIQEALVRRNPPPPSSFDRLVARLYRSGSRPVKLNQRYEVTISSSASNLEGIGLEEPYEFAFTTGGARIVRTWPEEGDEKIYLLGDDGLLFEFNTRIDRRSFEQAFRIRPEAGSVPFFVFERIPSGDRVRAEIIVDEKTRYTVTIGSQVRTLDGMRIENTPYQFDFRTTSLGEMGSAYDENYLDFYEGEWERAPGQERRERLRYEETR